MASAGGNSATAVVGGANTSYLLNGIVDGKSLTVMPRPADTIFLHKLKVGTRSAQVRPLHSDFAPAA